MKKYFYKNSDDIKLTPLTAYDDIDPVVTADKKNFHQKHEI